uniref:Uncharacterized protein n=1 Tax=Panagrolaimus sp. JU765 TaxID=591449 RepID=A0AC34RPT0_9BILA
MSQQVQDKNTKQKDVPISPDRADVTQSEASPTQYSQVSTKSKQKNVGFKEQVQSSKAGTDLSSSKAGTDPFFSIAENLH